VASYTIPSYVGDRESFTREKILERLRASIEAGQPIIGAGASVGIVAKFAGLGGADLIICYSTGRSRIMGLPTTVLGHSNRETLGLYPEIANVVDNTPIIGGAEAGDPTHRRSATLIDEFQQRGYDGIINFPSVGARPDFGNAREHIGQGFNQEFALIGLARQKNYFTMGYAYSVKQARGLAAAGVDVQVAHAGWTTGGAQGSDPKIARDLSQVTDHVQAIIEATREENPDSICLAHGGAIADPEDTVFLYENTDAVGFVGASSIERIPIERAILQTVKEFKGVPLPKSKG
jgi:predicted TIM-barrel enzyme